MEQTTPAPGSNPAPGSGGTPKDLFAARFIEALRLVHRRGLMTIAAIAQATGTPESGTGNISNIINHGQEPRAGFALALMVNAPPDARTQLLAVLGYARGSDASHDMADLAPAALPLAVKLIEAAAKLLDAVQDAESDGAGSISRAEERLHNAIVAARDAATLLDAVGAKLDTTLMATPRRRHAITPGSQSRSSRGGLRLVEAPPGAGP